MNKVVLAAGLVVTTPLLALLLVNLRRDPAALQSPLVANAAPNVVLHPLGNGSALDLASLKGRPVVVNFWASWCVPCVQEHQALTDAARANPGVTFVGVVYEDTEDNARAFLSERGSAYTSYLDPDGKAAIAFGIYGVPESYFINPQGMVTSKFVGPLDPQTLNERLDAAR
jgi:cytochrome c biogenesis protein CcmG, thiol:disulfide interchange protein DsbE